MSEQHGALADRLIGAKIVAVEAVDEQVAALHFEHRGTDDDSGRIFVALIQVKFTERDS